MAPRLFVLLLLGITLPICLCGRHGNKHGGGNKLIELLTAGIVAKVLQQKDDGGGGGGGGQEYYTVPIPVPMGGTQAKHHHVTEKIIPIPIPHHTTRIIHINAGSHHGEGGLGGGFDHHGGGGGGGGGGYDDHHHDIGHGGEHGHGGGGGGDHHEDDHHHRHEPTIQQLMFHDGGVYGMPQPPRPPHHPYHQHHQHHPHHQYHALHPHHSHHHPHAMHMRRPVAGMVLPRHPGVPMPGMMPQINYGAAPVHHPATAAAQQQMVRVRHYYALPSARHRMLAYPHQQLQQYQQLQQQQQLQKYQQLLMLQQKRFPRPW